MTERFCDNILLNDPINVFGNDIGITMIALSTIYLGTSFLLIYFVKVQEIYAKRVDSKAVRIQIFPIYNYILWANAIVNLYVGFIGLYYTFAPFTNSGDQTSAWAFSVMWGLQHMVVEGVPIMLMQKGLGKHAIRQTLKLSLLWGVYTLFNTLAIYKTRGADSYAFSMVWQGVMLVGYFCLWALPQRKLFRRPAAINYSLFWFLFRALSMVATTLFFIPTTHPEGNCIYVIGTLFPYAILEPFVIYYTLLQDSKWWQGMDIMQGRRVLAAEEIRSPMAGLDLSINSAQSLAASMDNMGLGAYRKGSIPVRLLNFAYITMDTRRQLGSGSFSKVYLGSYRRQRCAIKMIFTLDLTQDVIRRVAAEAQILSMIKHPNIVSILGVSVLPPSVCILLELCEFGSLADVIKASGPLTGFTAGESLTPGGLTVSWADRLFLAVGCARGLHALHSFNSELCHRDIKSFNFLVDERLNAKVSDLELGITEEITRQAAGSGAGGQLSALRKHTSRFFGRKVSGFSVNSGSQSDAEQVSELGIGEGVLQADDFLANWSAPEVIKDGHHVQASDVYSFSLVLWEILTGLVPFSDIRRQDDIRFKVLSGERPELPECVFEAPAERRFYEHYTALIMRGWQHEAALRPSSSEMLAELECLWLSCCGSLLYDTDVAPDLSDIYDGHSGRQARFSMWSTATPAAASHYTPGNGQSGGGYVPTESSKGKIMDLMQGDQETFEALDGHPGAWLVVTSESPHVVLRCNVSFTALSGLQLSEVIGLPLRDTALFGEETEIAAADEFAASMAAFRGSGPGHTVLTLYSSIVVGGEVRFQTPSLYSLHAFPVVRRSANSSGNVPIPQSKSAPSLAAPLESTEEGGGVPGQPASSMANSLPADAMKGAVDDAARPPMSSSLLSTLTPPIRSLNISSPTKRPPPREVDAAVDILVASGAPDGSNNEDARLSAMSCRDSTVSAAAENSLRSSRSFFSGFKKTNTTGGSSSNSQSLSGSRLNAASLQRQLLLQQQQKPVAVIAVLISRVKDLSAVPASTTTRASGLFRLNSTDGSRSVTSSLQNSHSLAEAFAQESMDVV